MLRAALSAFVAASVAIVAAGCGDRATRDASVRAANESAASAAASVVVDEALTALESAATSAQHVPSPAAGVKPGARSRARDPFLPSSSRRIEAAVQTPSQPRASVSAKAAAASTSRHESSLGPLLGVMKREGVRYALFGERFVAQGETAGGWTIKKIGENRCVLERGGKTKTLKPGEAP
ncbi:MAG: hypothetical protein ACKVU1_01925 [bacterium]